MRLEREAYSRGSDALPNDGTPEERYGRAGLDLASFRPLDEWEQDGEARVGPPEALVDVVPGDPLWDATGREWTVREVLDGGLRLEDANGQVADFTWHAAMTLCLRSKPAHPAD
jgi:hypothetical protein